MRRKDGCRCIYRTWVLGAEGKAVLRGRRLCLSPMTKWVVIPEASLAASLLSSAVFSALEPLVLQPYPHPHPPSASRTDAPSRPHLINPRSQHIAEPGKEAE